MRRLQKVLHRHVHDDHRRGPGDGGPVDIGRHRARGIVAGQKDNRVIDVAVGGRDAGIGQPADAGGDARHDAERNAGLGELAGFLSAAAEDEGIAALEPQDAISLCAQARSAVKEISRCLGEGLPPRLPAYSTAARPARPAQDVGIDQRVVDNDVTVLQSMIAEKRQKPWRAGARSNEPDAYLGRTQEKSRNRDGQSLPRRPSPKASPRLRCCKESARSMVPKLLPA